MSGSRRVQRSIRVIVATLLVVVAAGGVVAAVVAGSAVSVAAVVAAVVGMVAVRIMHAEVIQTRRRSSADRSAQAKSFGAALVAKQAEHTAFTLSMTSRLAEKDQTIRELDGTVRLADRRADIAEERVRRESKRANEAQARLSDLLDDVLAAREEIDESGETALQDLPTIVDLLAWEDRVGEATEVEELRKQA
jgi:hypothetical protein